MAEGQRPMADKDGGQIMHGSANASSQAMENMMISMANMMSAIAKINEQLAQASAQVNNHQNATPKNKNGENGDAEKNNE